MIGPLKPGDGITLGWMNGLRELAGSGRLKVDPRTGLGLVTTPFGAVLRLLDPPDGWFLVTSNLGGGAYVLQAQIEGPGGSWSSGPKVVTAREANLNPGVPAGPTRVWAGSRKGQWRFAYGACS